MKINKQIIDKAFSQTSKFGRKDSDKIKIDRLRREYILTFNKYKERYKFYLDNLKEWELNLLMHGELDDKIININENRFGFKRDRDCYIDNIYYPDRWFSTFMMIINNLFEEKVTLSLFRKDNVTFDFYMKENNLAPRLDSFEMINAQPDFVILDKDDNEKGYVEQKSIHNKYNDIFIRKSQYILFNKMLNNNKEVYILTRTHYDDYIEYNFYNYIDIQKKLRVHKTRGYVVNISELESDFTYKDYIV